MTYQKNTDNTVNLDDWLTYLEHSDDSYDDKIKLLEMIWHIITDIVAIGHGVHTIQYTDGCGQNGKKIETHKTQDSDLLESECGSLMAEYCAENIKEDSTHA